MYENQNAGWVPPADGTASATDVATWYCRIEFVLTGQGVATNQPNAQPWDASQYPLPIFICPNSYFTDPTQPNEAGANYGFNTEMVPKNAETAAGIYTYKITALPLDDRLILIGDKVGAQFPSGSRNTDYKLCQPLPFCNSGAPNRYYPDPCDGSLPISQMNEGAVRNNHNGRSRFACFLYADGHVEAKAPADTWKGVGLSGVGADEWERN
jgi:prepilin-type processing-associated H-X9-DG protein